MKKVMSYKARHVCLTGGEPLLQQPCFSLMEQLCDKGFKVSLETSGDKSCMDVDSRVLKVVDIKTPGSGEVGRFDMKNLDLSPKSTEFKFVICNEEDFLWAEKFCKEHDLFQKFCVFYSPSHEQVSATWLADKVLSHSSPARLQVQLHKYLWPGVEQGV